MKATTSKKRAKNGASTSDEILVVTSGDAETRGWGPKPLKVSELASQMNLFINQLGEVIGQTPAKVSNFHFETFEIQAEITAKGSLALLGTGGEAGAKGGIKFVFKRSSS